MACLLRCEKLTKEYGKGGSLTRAVKSVSLSFPSKGLVAISGKSGCGKSTFLSLLSSLEKPTSGKVFYQGNDIGTLSPDKLAKYRGQCMGMIFQHYNLFEDDTVIENVELPLLINGVKRKDAKKIALKSLQEFMMQGFARRKVATLSGGEKQRVAICRAMASSPRILFADEPTGALDEFNSKLVMNALKRLSQSMLVILVSHNAELTEEYADHIIRMESGKILDRPSFEQAKVPSKKLGGHSSAFASRFTKKNMKANKGNGILCGIASAVGFLSVCVTLGYFFGSKEAIKGIPLRSLDSSVASMYVEEKVETDSTFALVQQARPDIEAARAFTGREYIVDLDLSYFFPKASGFTFKSEVFDPVTFSCVYDLSPSYGFDDLLQKGEGVESLEMEYCFVNELLCEKLGDDCLGKTISMEFSNEITSFGKADEVKISIDMVVAGVVKEFGFLNEPKIYYSYLAAKELLSRYELSNASFALQKETTAYDVIAMAPGDSPISSFALNVFAKRFADSPNLFAFIEKNNGDMYSISSRSHTAYTSFSSLMGAFETCLFLFVGVSGVMLAIMLSMSAYAAFAKRKKDASILCCLGGKRSDLLTIFAIESVAYSALGCAVGIILSPLAGFGINLLMGKSFDVGNVIRIPLLSLFDIPLLLPIGCMLLAILISLISTVLVISVAGRFSIVEELRDE